MSVIRRFLALGALSFLISVPAGLAQSSMSQSDPATAGTMNTMGKSSSSLTLADKKFMKEAAQGGEMEVQLGQLALKNSSNQEVREFAQRMITDHSKANEQLAQVAAKDNVTLPSQPGAKEKATRAMLSKLTGEKFDKAYMKDMVTDHKADIAAFQQESNFGHANVKSFASDTLPTLQSHLQQAEQVNSGEMQQSSMK